MTGRIVVGIDGSKQSANALEWAAARAALGGEELQLLSGYSITPALDFYGYHSLGDTQPIDWYAEYAKKLVEAGVERVREVAPDLTCTSTVEMGHPASLLTQASEGAAAVVVGRRGLGSAASALLGSVSNRLTVQAKCPVVVVGDEVPADGPVVVGVDGSEFGTNALRFAIAEAALRKTSVRAVLAYDVLSQAFQADPELLARMRADVEGEAADTITEALDDVRGTDLASVTVDQVTYEGRAADAILGHADDAQLIVVGTHGKGFVRRLLLGSVSRQILSDAGRPVAIVDLPD